MLFQMSAKRSYWVLGILFLTCLSARAQEKGQVVVIKDPRIEALQERRFGTKITAGTGGSTAAQPVDKTTATRTTQRGFRVQIYSGSSRNEAYAEQARFQRLYKDIDTYVSYEEPNYRVKVGDFRGRSEANRLMQSLRGQFNSVFIFTEDIFVYH